MNEDIYNALKVIDKVTKEPVKEGHLGDMAQRVELDHEVQMARAQLYKIAKYAIKMHEMLKGVSEVQGLEGWVSAKITKASTYMSDVGHYLEYEMSPANIANESKQEIDEASDWAASASTAGDGGSVNTRLQDYRNKAEERRQRLLRIGVGDTSDPDFDSTGSVMSREEELAYNKLTQKEKWAAQDAYAKKMGFKDMIDLDTQASDMPQGSLRINPDYEDELMRQGAIDTSRITQRGEFDYNNPGQEFDADTAERLLKSKKFADPNITDPAKMTQAGLQAYHTIDEPGNPNMSLADKIAAQTSYVDMEGNPVNSPVGQGDEASPEDMAAAEREFNKESMEIKQGTTADLLQKVDEHDNGTAHAHPHKGYTKAQRGSMRDLINRVTNEPKEYDPGFERDMTGPPEEMAPETDAEVDAEMNADPYGADFTRGLDSEFSKRVADQNRKNMGEYNDQSKGTRTFQDWSKK
jgi:hypothetical protein